MGKKIRNQNIIMGAVGTILCLAIAAFLFVSLNALLGQVKSATETNIPTQQQVVRFNIQGLRELGIIK